MKRSFLMFFVLGVTLILLGCSESNPLEQSVNKSNEVTLSLAKKPAPKLNCTTEYSFMGHLGIFDGEGRLLAWEGPISGDIDGVIKWWMVLPMTYTGQASHYTDRFEIWNEGNLILAGAEAGTTTTRHGKNSNWRTNGTVTEAYGEFEEWIGRKNHAEGHFTWAAPGLPDQGYGSFRIN